MGSTESTGILVNISWHSNDWKSEPNKDDLI